jgi:hypothetical protein
MIAVITPKTERIWRMKDPAFDQTTWGCTRRVFWPFRAYVSSLCVLATLTGTCVAQSVPDPDCLKSSLADYWKANSTILERLTAENPILSPEDQIGLRRFKEQYCIRYAQCLYGTTPESAQVLPYRATFSACVRNRKLDPQIALPNNK